MPEMTKGPAMKTKPRKKAAPAPVTPAEHAVHFEFHDNDAGAVCLAGSFNAWHPSATPMVPMGGGRWAKEITLPPGVHEYLFVVDGRWIADPGAAVTVSNPFGGINCCVKVD
jgi:1,4-alpha-glucan branching enzyme